MEGWKNAVIKFDSCALPPALLCFALLCFALLCRSPKTANKPLFRRGETYVMSILSATNTCLT